MFRKSDLFAAFPFSALNARFSPSPSDQTHSSGDRREEDGWLGEVEDGALELRWRVRKHREEDEEVQQNKGGRLDRRKPTKIVW
jgi:hypothetical protein